MLRKLYKHEFISLYRILLPLYGLLIGLSAVVKILSLIKIENRFMSTMSGITITLTTIMAIGLMFAGFVLVVVNFYKSLLGKQGYLTFSLPLKVKDHIICKLICGVVTSITSIIAEFIAMCILLSDYGIIKNIFEELRIAFNALTSTYGNGKVVLVCVEIVIIAIASLSANLLMFFAAMSMGQLFKNKKLGSVGMYFALYVAMQTILSILMSVIISIYAELDISQGFIVLQQYLLFIAVILLVQIGLYFGISNYFLSKKLNLE